MKDFKTYLAAVAAGEPLAEEEARAAFSLILIGEATPAQLGAFLMGLRLRGETVDEIVGATRAMRAAMIPVAAPPGAIDIVGTGGDGAGTWNISTLAAIIAAAAGATVAKHGGKASSSRSGASDVLGELGVRVGMSPGAASACLREAGLCFMAGPTHHTALRHAGPVRAELGLRTIFNLLGPLSNPALVRRQLVGVFAERWIEPLAVTLGNLGSTRAWVVHGSDGMDEITTTGPTAVAELRDGAVRRFDITPEDAGLPRADLADLKGGTPAENGAAIMALLGGKPGAFRDIVLLNAAAALIVGGKAATLTEGAQRAVQAIDSGAAMATLSQLIAITNTRASA